VTGQELGFPVPKVAGRSKDRENLYNTA